MPLTNAMFEMAPLPPYLRIGDLFVPLPAQALGAPVYPQPPGQLRGDHRPRCRVSGCCDLLRQDKPEDVAGRRRLLAKPGPLRWQQAPLDREPRGHRAALPCLGHSLCHSSSVSFALL